MNECSSKLLTLMTPPHLGQRTSCIESIELSFSSQYSSLGSWLSAERGFSSISSDRKSEGGDGQSGAQAGSIDVSEDGSQTDAPEPCVEADILMVFGTCILLLSYFKLSPYLSDYRIYIYWFMNLPFFIACIS